MIRLLIIGAVLLAACTPMQRDQVTREAARSVVNRVVAERFPGLPAGSTIDCVIDNATMDELLSLASETVTGPTAASTQTVSAIATRPRTIACLASEGLPALIR